MKMIVDLIIIAIILLSTFLAYRKGLVKLAIGLVAFIISIVITFVLYLPVSNLVINCTGIDEMVENAIYEKANDIMKENDGEEITNQIVETAKNEMLPETARTLAENIVRGGVLIVLFIAIRIALRFVTLIADLVAKLPILNQINKVGGIVYGILRGILIIYILLLLVNVAGQINSQNVIHQNVQESYIGKMMYEHNILNILF